MKIGSRTYFWSIRLFGLFGLFVLLGAQQKAVAFAQPKLPEPPARHASNQENDRPRREPVSLQQTLPDGIAARTVAEIAPTNPSMRGLPIFPQIGSTPNHPYLPASIANALISIFLERQPVTIHRPKSNLAAAHFGDRSAFCVCLCRTGPPLV